MSNFKTGDLVKLLNSEDIYSVYKVGNLKFTNEEVATIYLHKGTSNKIKLEVYTKELVRV